MLCFIGIIIITHVNAQLNYDLTAELIISNLDKPLFVTHAPNDNQNNNRLFIVEQAGLIKVINSDMDQGLSIFLDIRSIVNPGYPFYSEQGLLGLAFHPNYQNNGWFYVYYSSHEGIYGNTKLARYSVTSDPNVANSYPDKIIITIEQPDFNHKGGWLSFGPDGYLYLSTGDGGVLPEYQDLLGTSQNRNSLLGKILRIDVNSGVLVPPGNPFNNLVWAYGLRNPWRCSFDRLTGDLYIADAGSNSWEEINFQPRNSVGGENYGWKCMEGFMCTGYGGCVCDSPTLKSPLYTYPSNNNNNIVITGGYVYRGSIPSLYGYYIFGDYIGTVWALKHNGIISTEIIDITNVLKSTGADFRAISSFGEDSSGEIYICDHYNGKIYKIKCNLRGDLDSDCKVNISDLAILLLKWGPCTCKEDIDMNGIVNISDLAIVLLGWTN